MPILGIIASRDGGTPTAPTIGTATATGATTATVAYTASTYTGKGTATYVATSSPGGLTGTGASPITVTGLTSGTAYTFTVTATSTTGQTATSAASNSVTPSVPGFIFQIGRTGTTFGNGAPNTDLLVASNGDITSLTWNAVAYKINSTGTLQWQKSYTSAIYPTAITQDSSDNLYIGGYNTGTLGYFVIKTNSAGTVQWSMQGSSGSYSGPYQMKTDSSANIILSGQTNYTYGGGWIQKLDSSGNFLWGYETGGSRGNIRNGAATVDSSGNVYFILDNSNSGTFNAPFLYKYNSSGTLQWFVQYGIPSTQSLLTYVHTDSSGNAYMLLRSTNGDGTILKINSSGTLQWQRKISGGTAQFRCTTDSSGNVYGYFASTNANCHVLKWDSSGTLQWQRVWTSTPGTLTMYGSGGGQLNIIGTDYILTTGLDSTTGTGGYVIFRAPVDGSKTGTYTNTGISYTYAASSLTESAAGMSNPGNTSTPSNNTNSFSAFTPVVTNTSFTSNVITI